MFNLATSIITFSHLFSQPIIMLKSAHGVTVYGNTALAQPCARTVNIRFLWLLNMHAHCQYNHRMENNNGDVIASTISVSFLAPCSVSLHILQAYLNSTGC